jgi:hypothetical protein
MQNIQRKNWNSIRIRWMSKISLYTGTFQLSETLFLRKTIKFELINVPPLQIWSCLEELLLIIIFWLNSFQVSEKLFLRKTIKGKSINIPPLQISSYLEFQFFKAFPLKNWLFQCRLVRNMIISVWNLILTSFQCLLRLVQLLVKWHQDSTLLSGCSAIETIKLL